MYFRGADVDAKDIDQDTPLQLAAAKGHTAAVKVLIENNANMEVKDNLEDQPIHHAALFGHFGYVVYAQY